VNFVRLPIEVIPGYDCPRVCPTGGANCTRQHGAASAERWYAIRSAAAAAPVEDAPLVCEAAVLTIMDGRMPNGLTFPALGTNLSIHTSYPTDDESGTTLLAKTVPDATRCAYLGVPCYSDGGSGLDARALIEALGGGWWVDLIRRYGGDKLDGEGEAKLDDAIFGLLREWAGPRIVALRERQKHIAACPACRGTGIVEIA